MPAVDDNGLSHRFEFMGDYVITSFSSSETYVKLGYNGAPSYAAMVAKSPIDSKAFRTDIRMIIRKSTKSDGIAVWISKEKSFEKGSAFGRKGVEGLLIAIVTKGDVPYIGINLGDNSQFTNFSQTVKLSENIYDELFTLRITADNGLNISLGKNHKFTEVFKIAEYAFPLESYLGLSVNNSTGYSDFRIQAIRQSAIEYPMFKAFDDERGGGSKWIWLIFFLVIGVIGFVLYKKQVARKK